MHWLNYRFLCVALFGCNGGGSIPETLDFVLAGGTVYDGQDSEPVIAGIGIQGDRIVALGNLKDRPADFRLDVGGCTVRR